MSIQIPRLAVGPTRFLGSAFMIALALMPHSHAVVRAHPFRFRHPFIKIVCTDNDSMKRLQEARPKAVMKTVGATQRPRPPDGQSAFPKEQRPSRQHLT